MRDQAQRFTDAGCRIVGISFDTPADNRAFREKSDFPYSLLSDTDRSVGAVYDAGRPEGDPYADYPKRISYLIDPQGIVRRAYEVDDPAGHAEAVLADLKDL